MKLLPLSATALVVAALTLTGCSSSSDQSAESPWATATTAEAGGGMEALISAAQEEGTLNTMGLFDDWANYGALKSAFTEKYGIEINNDVSMSSSQEQINVIQQRVGQDRSIDYLDTGVSFAEDGAAQNLLAEYRPAGAENLDGALRSKTDQWTSQYGGYMSIGCDTTRIDNCPTALADLAKPEYKGKIGAFEDPTSGELEFNIVWAMSLANGGSLEDIQPGVDFFQKLSDSGNMTKVVANDGTIERGETPIVLSWDYLNVASAAKLADAGIDFAVNVPTDVLWSSYYAASINADAPHPAAARLWLEFIFSEEGQNIFLQGQTRPVRLAEMTEAGTADAAALAELPAATGEALIPSGEQREAAKQQLTSAWLAITTA